MATSKPSSSLPISRAGSQHDTDAFDLCRPAEPAPEHETDSERIARLQHELDSLRACINAELRVRAESSLLTLVLFKVVLPVIALAAGFAAIYAGILRSGRSEIAHPEIVLGIGYAIIAIGAILLWRSFRRPGSGGRGDALDHSVRRALRIDVPPSKEKIARNNLVNRWIFFWATWGLIVGLPLIFFVFRSNALERAGLHLTFDTGNVCAPTVGGFNPYAGSDVCTNSGYTYASPADAATSAIPGMGSAPGIDSLQTTSAHTAAEIETANIRLDVTTTLVVYFLILIVGILVNMIRWWRTPKMFAIQPVPPPAPQ
ncbi:MAG: hypothetical protein IT339_01485 [Thermomicrobiales bacterium]|nr:hypothetical protein [Thermomicrobiales bacterium]